MSKSLCDAFGRFRCWNYSSGVSDHKAIVLQLDFELGKVMYPFKFNATWLENVDFISLIKKQWVLLQGMVPPHFSAIKSLLFKLDKLGSLVRTWETDFKKKSEERLCSIEKEIASAEVVAVSNLFCLIHAGRLKERFV